MIDDIQAKDRSRLVADCDKAGRVARHLRHAGSGRGAGVTGRMPRPTTGDERANPMPDALQGVAQRGGRIRVFPDDTESK